MADTINLNEDLLKKGKKFNKTQTISERQEAKRNPHENPDDDTLQGVEAAFRRAAENRKKINIRNV